MMRIILFIALFLNLLPQREAFAQPLRTLVDGGTGGAVIAEPNGRTGGETLRLQRAGRNTNWSATDQRFAAFREGAPVPIGSGETALGVTGWTGGAYCCWTLHLFRPGTGGLAHVASLPLGKREPDIVRLVPAGGSAIRLTDATFDFWEAPVSLATDLAPSVPMRWTGRGIEPDRNAMRRTVTEALGTACADMAAAEDQPAPGARLTTYPNLNAAIAALRARNWRRPDPGSPHPGVEAARLAACLIYSGHAAEARRLLRTAWPLGHPGFSETERQLAARLACSPYIAVIRSINGPGAPYLAAQRCDRNGPGQTALYRLNWR